MKTYRPLPPYLTIKPSEIDGLGVFTTDDIDAKHCIGVTHIFDARFQDGYIRTPLGGFFNHSETPNCELIDDGDLTTLVTIREIKNGEELTAKYTLYTPSQ